MTHSNADPATPYSFDATHVQSDARKFQDDFIVERLHGSAFVSLASVNEYRLSLGILGPPKGEKFPEDPFELASVVSRYVRSPVSENFIKILVQIDTKRKTTLGSTSQLCLFLGQDQMTIVDEGVALGDLKGQSPTHLRLQAMAEDLEETGVILMNVAKSLDLTNMTRVRVQPLIEETWKDLKAMWQLKDIDFSLKGDCSVVADEEDLYIIVARILQWFAQRKAATEPPNEPTIIVNCESDDRTAHLVFEDRSRRLPPRLRERLFEPFTLAVPSARSLGTPERTTETAISDDEIKVVGRRPSYLPLYLAKTLVEEKYRGWLEDKSDEMEGEAGHRLVMQLHKAFESEAVKAAV